MNKNTTDIEDRREGLLEVKWECRLKFNSDLSVIRKEFQMISTPNRRVYGLAKKLFNLIVICKTFNYNKPTNRGWRLLTGKITSLLIFLLLFIDTLYTRTITACVIFINLKIFHFICGRKLFVKWKVVHLKLNFSPSWLWPFTCCCMHVCPSNGCHGERDKCATIVRQLRSAANWMEMHWSVKEPIAQRGWHFVGCLGFGAPTRLNIWQAGALLTRMLCNSLVTIAYIHIHKCMYVYTYLCINSSVIMSSITNDRQTKLNEKKN